MKVKLLSETAKLPIKADKDAIGWDVFCDSIYVKDGALVYGTGIAVQPPKGFYYQFIPRSSQTKSWWVWGNSVGIIDPNYTGEIQARMRPVGDVLVDENNKLPYVNFYDGITVFKEDRPFSIGDRIGQLVLHHIEEDEDYNIEVVNHFEETTRGSGGFGSTGK